MRDIELRIAQHLSNSYADLAPMFGWDVVPKSWNNLTETQQKHLIALVEKLINDKLISPGRFFRYMRIEEDE